MNVTDYLLSLLRALYTNNFQLGLVICWPITELPEKLSTFSWLCDWLNEQEHELKVVRVEDPLARLYSKSSRALLASILSFLDSYIFAIHVILEVIDIKMT